MKLKTAVEALKAAKALRTAGIYAATVKISEPKKEVGKAAGTAAGTEGTETLKDTEVTS